MRSDAFYFEIKDIMTQFVAAFNNIVIKRHNKDRDVRSRIHVRYVYAPKQRVVHDLTNKARHLTLPVVAVNINSVSRDESRVFNKIDGSYLHNEETHPSAIKSELSLETRHVLQPVPINIEVNMSMMARYQTDIEQIISNFVPYNDPYIIISWKIPSEFTPNRNREIRSEVLWSGNLNMDYPDVLSGTEPYRLSCDTSFTIKTWLFKKAPAQPVSNIYKITTNMTPMNDLPGDLPYTLPIYDQVTERSYVETFGPPLTSAPYITHVDTVGKYNEIWGYNFNSTSAVYVSGFEINQLSGTQVTPFDATTHAHLDENYPAFTGVSIPFKVIDDNRLYFDTSILSQSVSSGDVIVLNAGGYSTGAQSPSHQSNTTFK